MEEVRVPLLYSWIVRCTAARFPMFNPSQNREEEPVLPCMDLPALEFRMNQNFSKHPFVFSYFRIFVVKKGIAPIWLRLGRASLYPLPSAQSLRNEIVVRVAEIKIGVGKLVVGREVAIGVFLDQLRLAVLVLGPIVGCVANGDIQLVVDIDPRDVEEEVSPRHRVNDLDAGARSFFDGGSLEEADFALAVFAVLFADFQ